MDPTTRRTFLLALGAALVSGCASAIDPEALPTPPTDEPNLPTTDPEQPATIVPIGFDGERATARSFLADSAAKADRNLAARMYGLIAQANSGHNLIFSPFSVATAFAMLLVGAQGTTRDQLVDALGAASPDWDESRNALDRVAQTPKNLPPEADPLELDIVNTPYGQNGFTFGEDFLEILATHYAAELKVLDFALDAEAARTAINGDVATQTRDRITDLLPAGSIDNLSRLVLVNTVFFKATWINEFDPSRTKDALFELTDQTSSTVPMMNASVRTTYATGDGWRMVRLRYWGGYSMLAVLPDAGQLAAVEAQLQSGLLDELGTAGSTHIVDVSIPKFDYKTETDLAPVMQSLGVVDAFSAAAADLSGISEEADLYVSGAFHQATIEVDEVGTTATAATAAVISATSAPPPASFIANRPFLYVIEHDETHEPLFIGRVSQP